jgi:hypothetical protein
MRNEIRSWPEQSDRSHIVLPDRKKHLDDVGEASGDARYVEARKVATFVWKECGAA